MATTKETLPTIATDSAVSQTNTRVKRDSAHMRSDAVSLEVPVKVHGSRLHDTASGATPNNEAFEEQTSTMIVFPQGGVLKMATPVAAGQMMVVTNLKSGHDSICRVVKVRAYGAGQSYVEVEFTHRQPGYWGVYFPSDGSETTNQLSPIPPATLAPPPVSTELKVEKRLSPEAASALPSLPKPPVAKSPGPADSVFAPIGSQEPVQPAASATSSRVKPGSIAEHAGKHRDFETVVSPVVDSLPTAPSSPVASVSLGELQGDDEAAPAVSFAGAGVPGEVADAALLDSAPRAQHSAPIGHFATTLGASERTPGKGKHKAAIALGAVALVVVAGAAYYFQWLPFVAKPDAKPAATIPAPAELPVTAIPPQTNLAPQPSSTPANPATIPPTTGPTGASGPSPRASATAPAPSRPSKFVSETPAATASGAPATMTPSSKVPDMFVALNAHPTSRAYSADSGPADGAPAVDSENSDAGLSAIGPSAEVPPPSVEPEAPVRIHVGGEIKPPRLVSSVLPVYPAVARETGIEGDVVIDTTIDKTGKVTGMKVVSGNAMLRQAALDALRQWKYEPSKLNGEPVPVQMTVTIKFHHQ